MSPFIIGLSVGLVPFLMMYLLFRLAPKPEKRNLLDANDLLRERNAIGERQVTAIEQLVETMQLKAPDEVQTTGEFMTVRKDDPEHVEYLNARFAEKSSGPFMWKGRRWRYEYTKFDDAGEYDLLWRPSDDRAKHGSNPTGQAIEADLIRTRKERNALMAAADGLLEVIEAPDSNCSCHQAAPCHDCVEYGGLREAIKQTRAAIGMVAGRAE